MFFCWPVNMMNDIILEFLEVSFHSLLYYSNIYPKEIFEDRKKYGAPVKYSLHPELNNYITDCLKSIQVLLELDSLERVSFCILNRHQFEVRRFIFVVNNINDDSQEATDHYLVKCEQSLRALCMKLANCKIFSEPLPEECTFTIMVYTTECGAVKLAKKPELEHFPFVEKDQEYSTNENEFKILPIHTINMDSGFIQVYAEHT